MHFAGENKTAKKIFAKRVLQMPPFANLSKDDIKAILNYFDNIPTTKKTDMRIEYATTTEDLTRCFEVMKELRPHHNLESFLVTMSDMKKEGYKLLYLEDEGRMVSVAGFRFTTTLYDGLIIDFDDFVTLADGRSKGYGSKLFDTLVGIAKERGIKAIHLNSNHQRFDAHRFYLNKKMKIMAHHFRLEV